MVALSAVGEVCPRRSNVQVRACRCRSTCPSFDARAPHSAAAAQVRLVQGPLARAPAPRDSDTIHVRLSASRGHLQQSSSVRVVIHRRISVADASSCSTFSTIHLEISPVHTQDPHNQSLQTQQPVTMTSTAQRRLLQEYRMLTNNPPDGITAGPVSEDDLLNWQALIQGPEGTPFEGGVFPAELKFPSDYPLSPPTMKFLGELWHPNGMLSCRLYADCTPERRLTARTYSLPKRPSLYLHPPSRRRRSQPLRARLRALVAHPVRREDPAVCHESPGRA